MVDDKKVYRVEFDTRSAIKAISAFESKLMDLEKKVASTFGKKSSSMKTGIDKTTTAALAMRKALEKANAKIAATSAAPTKGMTRIATATDRAKEAGKALDRLMSAASRKAVSGQRKVAKAVEATDRAIRKTDEDLKKAMRPKGERRKARDIRSIGTAAGFASQSLTKLIAKGVALFGAFRGIRGIVDDFLEFDEKITLAGAKFSKLEPALTPGTEAFKNFRSEIRDATADMEHSAGAVAGAVDFWAKAGKTSDQTKAVIATTGNFASANTDAAGSMLDMAQAGDILSDTLGQFQLDSADPTQLMKNTARVSDVMSASANTANFSAVEMFESFKTAGPILTAVGGSIEETSALLAVMANAGLKGSIAGRSLKIATAAINAPTAAQTKLYEKYNIVTQDAQGNMLSLTDIIGQLDKSTQGLGTGERFGVFAKMFGRQGVTGFLNLLSKGENEIGKMTDKLRDASGETDRLAKITRTSANAQIKLFWKNLKDLGARVITGTDLFGKLGNSIGKIDWVKAATFITDDLVPALNTVGKIIADVLYPAFLQTADMLETIFAPALWAIEKVFGAVGESGDGLATVLAILATLWTANQVGMIAMKSTGMISWFVRLVTQVTAASAAQTALGTSTAATNGVMATQVSRLGALKNGAIGVASAFTAGWVMGSIIHDQLVEPLMKAQFELDSLKASLDQTRQKGLDRLNTEQLKDEARDVDKAIAGQKTTGKTTGDLISIGTGMGGGLGALQQFRQQEKELNKLETQKAEIQAEFDRKRTAENIKRFQSGDLLQPQSVAPSQLDLGDRFGHGANLGQEFGVLPEQGSQTQMMKLTEKMAAEYKQFHNNMLAQNAKSGGGGAAVQNIEIGPTEINMTVGSGDPEEIGRIVKSKMKESNRNLAAELARENKTVGPSEI